MYDFSSHNLLVVNLSLNDDERGPRILNPSSTVKTTEK